MVLIAVVLALVLPRYGGILIRGGMRSEARRLAAAVRYLRHEASRTDKTHYLTFDLSTDSYAVTIDEGKGRPVEESTHLAKAHVLAEGIRFKDVMVYKRGQRSEGKQVVGFYPKGESDEAIVHFSDYAKGRFCTLHIKPYNGRSDIYDYYYKGYREVYHK
jgi:Tfp pilus assembly protein FimT